ncbi:MAG: DUF5996 family protein [Burkholderiales bacterium]
MPLSWPDIPYEPWRETCTALHLYSQIVGKYRLARTPWVNHSWHATLYVNARGLTSSLVEDGPGGIEVVLDFIEHAVVGYSSDGRTARLPLGPMSVADFHARFLGLVCEVGGTPELHGRPNEIPNAVPFTRDREPRPYDADAASRFFQALVSIDRVLNRFRTSFLGKVSPVHLFWGSFDLAVTRFSGCEAPPHPGGIPALPDEVTREAYSHEVSSAGFWPGGGLTDFPAFYSYAYPQPRSFEGMKVEPEEAYFDANLREFVLPYEAVRQAADPGGALTAFLESTYRAAADLGHWERSTLECAPGVPLRPRPLG